MSGYEPKIESQQKVEAMLKEYLACLQQHNKIYGVDYHIHFWQLCRINLKNDGKDREGLKDIVLPQEEVISLLLHQIEGNLETLWDAHDWDEHFSD